MRWFRIAAERGLAEAQYNLGVMHADGRGVERNLAEAARWYRLAAEQGVAQAQYNLGTLYGLGLGVPMDEARGAQWLHKAADQNMPEAQYNLGVLYEHGRGVRLDGRAALVWYQRAARLGYEPAEQRLSALRAKLNVEDWPESALAEPAAPPEDDSRAVEPIAVAQAAPESSHWLDALDPSHYTLQVLSDTKEMSVKRFIDEHLAKRDGGYFASRKQGVVWYSVVVGVYDSYESAKAAIAELPPKLRQAKPWVRNIGLVQKAMLR